MNKSSIGVAAAITVFLMPIVILLGIPVLLGGSPATASDCKVPSASLSGSKTPGAVGSFSGEQLDNAAAIMKAAKTLGLPAAAQLIGMQAAIGESTLRVIDSGDAAGPDSRGLFQQRANGAWGSYADRMNPTISATNFFKALQNVPGWEELDPSLAIHRVQRNDNPNHYTQFRAQAAEVVKALGGESTAGIDASGTCPAAGNAVVGDLAGKWVHPLPGSTFTSGYGPRPTPAGTINFGDFHYGVDFATPGNPGTIVAVTDMKIVKTRELDGSFGTGVTGVTLDGKLTIGFYHMKAGSLKVKQGDTVAAGTPLGTEGGTGNVTGPHLHMEFFQGSFDNPYVPKDPTVDPMPILKQKGVL
jgi:murein DD-endopeptidase MepM/ murein hydrolase activator NlpD